LEEEVIVRSMHLVGFMSHADSTVVLPADGVVIVTGPNGAGKSSLAEAVAWGLWGRTLRGTKPWRAEDVRCSVYLELEGEFEAHRVRHKGSTKLTWTEGKPGEAAPVYENTTKAQAALEALVGDFDVWRRTSVISSSDAAHFTLATDAERKRLLETILGLGRFDDASARCRIDLKRTEVEHLRADSAAREYEVLLESAQKQVARLQQSLDALPAIEDPAGLEATVKRASKLMAAAYQDVAKLQKVQQDASSYRAAASCAAERAETEYGRMAQGHCRECGQPWPQHELDEAKAVMEKRQAERAAAGTAYQEAADAVAEQTSELEQEIRELQAMQRDFSQRLGVARQALANRTSYEVALAEARCEEDEAKAQVEDRRREAVRLAKEHATLAAVDKVLSLTGVRAHVLSEALAGIEAAANAWLGRIAGWGLRLELRPYAERAGGGVKDAISLEVHGAGGGQGYRASSGGERRRIDVALLLALAEVAAAAHGSKPSTLFFDEAFDALDEDGIDAVCTVLEELAQTRPVVVITHNPLLEQRLRPELVRARLHVAAGGVSERGEPAHPESPHEPAP
jgi:DNA repair exonuclease SbcCD ATPase subunit